MDLQLYKLAFNLCLFSSYFLACRIKEENVQELDAWLTQQKSAQLLPLMLNHNIWSKVHLATTPMLVLPNEILQDRNFLAVYRQLKDQAAREVMLPLWLRDQQLAHYLKLSSHSLNQLGYKYPGEIYEIINEDTRLEQAERHLLRDDVHRFKQAVREFVAAPKNNIAVISHKERYEKELGSLSWHFSPVALLEYLNAHPQDVLLMVVYALVNHLVVMQAVPIRVPAQSSLLLSLVMFWVAPRVGEFHIYIMLLNRLLVDPVKTGLQTFILFVWMVASADHPYLWHTLTFSITPTLLFYAAISVLSFQPLVIKNKDTKVLDVTITGIGCLDSAVERFKKTKSIAWLCRKILSLTIEADFQWEQVNRIKLDEIDLNWQQCKTVILPALQANNLRTLWILNNRAFTDQEADQLADLLHKNNSVENLKVAFDYEYNMLEQLYHLFLWDAVVEGFTTKGAQALLDAVKDNQQCSIKSLDFYGIELDSSFLESARELKKVRPELVILGSKPNQLTRSISSRISRNRALRWICQTAIAGFLCLQIYNLLAIGDNLGLKTIWQIRSVMPQ